MKKISIKFLFVALITTLLLAFLSLHAGAASKKDLEFELNDDGVSYSVDNCDNTATGKLTIPSTYKGFAVTEIGGFAFSDCDRLTRIVIPDTVMYIHNLAFSGCRSLEKINIPDSVIYIGDSAFMYCSSLTSIKIPESVTYISDAMFENCGSLESVELPDGLTTIGVDAFASCDSLNNIVIPDSVTKIGDEAFMFCDSLESINIPDKITSISEDAFYECSNLERITIGKGLKNVGERAFYGCNDLTDVCFLDKNANKIDIKDSNSNFFAAEWHYCVSTVVKATISKNGKKIIKCNDCGKLVSEKIIYRPKVYYLFGCDTSNNSYVYDGKTKKPSVYIEDSKGKVLKNGTDYTVKYSKGRKSIGKYTVTVTFKGNYSGTKKLTFEIVPKKVTLSKLTAGKKQLTATWKTVSGATGYEVTYSTSKKFTKKTTKTVTIKKAKTKKTTIKKLKKGKKYYVKVRAYKTVSGKKIYGAYSSVKSVKVK